MKNEKKVFHFIKWFLCMLFKEPKNTHFKTSFMREKKNLNMKRYRKKSNKKKVSKRDLVILSSKFKLLNNFQIKLISERYRKMVIKRPFILQLIIDRRG